MIENYSLITDDIPKKSFIVTFFEYDKVIHHEAIPFAPLGWTSKNFDPNNQTYLEMKEKLNTILKNDEYPVFIYKNPHLEHEKRLHEYLGTKENYLLKDFSSEFCKISLNKFNDKSDMNCFK